NMVHARRVGRAQHYAVPGELVPGAQIGPAVSPTADLVQPAAVTVRPKRGIQISYPDLDIARSQYPVERHRKPPVRFAGSGGAFPLIPRTAGKPFPCSGQGMPGPKSRLRSATAPKDRRLSKRAHDQIIKAAAASEKNV